MAPTADGVPGSVDGRWLSLASATAPFERRNVRLQDVQKHIPLAWLNSVAVTIPQTVSRGVTETAVTEVREAMLMGEMPTAVAANAPAPCSTSAPLAE